MAIWNRKDSGDERADRDDDGRGGTEARGCEEGGTRRRRFGSLISMRPLPLAFPRGKPRPRRVRLWVHAWRYGLYHPDEDLLGVIDAAADSLITQIMAAEAILTGTRLEKLRTIREELDCELEDPVPELAVLLGIEAKINALYPPSVQRRRAWMIQERFSRVAPGHAADYWAADRPEAELAEEHSDRLKQCDAAVATAGVELAAAVDALSAAQRATTEAREAYAALRGQTSDDDPTVEALLDRLKNARETLPEADSDRAGLEQQAGALLDAWSRADAALAAEREAASAQASAAKAADIAQRTREATLARNELERIQSRLRGAQRAAAEGQGTRAGVEAQQLVALTDSELKAAREQLDSANVALAALGAAPDEGDEGDEPGTASHTIAGDVADSTGHGGNGAEGAIPPAVDADAQTLLGYIHSSYLMGIAREKAVRDLMRWLMMRFWTANIVMISILFLFWVMVSWTAPWLEALTGLVVGLFFVAAIGRVGATMSVVQRLQRAVSNNVLAADPIIELTRLRTGKNGINLALFSGGVFALMMYALFASGIPTMIGFDDGLAPSLARVQQDERQSDRIRELADAGQRVAEARNELNSSEERLRAARDASQPTGTPAADEGGASQPNEPQASEEAGSSSTASQLEGDVASARARFNDATSRLNAVAAAAQERSAQNAVIDPPRPTTSKPEGRGTTGGSGGEAQRQGWVTRFRIWLFGSIDEERRAQCKATDACDPFVQLADALGFVGRSDFFKLLIWAFIAGFAERLVPDVLDTIARRGRRRRQEGDGAATA